MYPDRPATGIGVHEAGTFASAQGAIGDTDGRQVEDGTEVEG